jgi:hypothetical protein
VGEDLWPLLGLTLLAAALRLPTLGLQSLWYDEAFTPVHVLHASLGATLRAVVHSENTPPLWYVLEWGVTRVLGTGEVALRLLSALAGVATVPVVWAIGRELSGRRAAMIGAALVASSPLFVWYSQEARAYALFVLLLALTVLCFLRAEREPTPRRLAAFALSGSLALLSHYFAVFMLIPMALWLLLDHTGDRTAEDAGARLPAVLGALGALTAVGLALIPLVVAQGGHGTQWIGRWALSARIEAIPQYYLTGASGAPLGRGVQALVGLIVLAGLAVTLWPRAHGGLEGREREGAGIVLAIGACGVLIPLALALFGADYLAPRNLVGAMVPLTAGLAVLLGARGTGMWGMVLGVLLAVAFLALSVDVNLSPRLQRGDWRGVARVLRGGAPDRVITTVELGAAPLEHYLPPLHNLARGASVRVSEIDETGYAPLRVGAGEPPVPGFRLAERRDVHGLTVYRFRSASPRVASEARLRGAVITLAHPEVLVPGSRP